MITNLHTHTPRCLHAEGAEEEYAKAAIAGGLKTLGFSDHTPQFFPGDYYSRMRMRPNELQEYADTVLQLRKSYAGQLDIRLGLEAEYYPALFPELISHLRDTEIEYLLLGQHWNLNEYDAPFNGTPTSNKTDLEQYCNQVIEAMYTGLFTYFAHPDLMYFVGDDGIYKQHMQRLCKAAKSCDVPLELNFLGHLANRHYPNMRFWEIAAEENCSVVFGCDAHRPQDTVQPETEVWALDVVQKYGLHLLPEAPIRKL